MKSNNYIEAKFTNYKPTLAQNRVVLWLGSLVHSREDEEFEEVEITANHLRSIMGHKYSTEQLIDELALLRSATAIMKQGSVWTAFGIIDRARLDEETGMVQLRLCVEMRPFLLKLGSNGEGFTSIDLEKVQGMRSVHSQRIYELLYQYKNLGRGDTREMKIQTLKEHLGLYEKKKGVVTEKFKVWSDFEKRVLRQAEKDLCNAGLFIDYTPIKVRNKVTSVRFTFSIQKDEMGEILQPFMRLQLTGLTQYDKIQIANTNPLDVVERAIIESDDSKSLKPLKSLIPKSRKAYNDAVKKMFSESLSAGD